MESRGEEDHRWQQRNQQSLEKQNLVIFLLAWCRTCPYPQQRIGATVTRCLLRGVADEIVVGADENDHDNGHEKTCTVFVETFSGKRVAIVHNLCAQTSTRQSLDSAIRAQNAALSEKTFRLYRQPEGGSDDAAAPTLSPDLLLVDTEAAAAAAAAAAPAARRKLLFKPLNEGGFGMRHNDAVFVVPTDFAALQRQLRTVASRCAYSAPKDAVKEFTRIFNVLLSCLDKIQTGIRRGPCASWGCFTYDGQVNEKGAPHGIGFALYETGSSYIGTWADGMMHGSGVGRWRGGKTFLGTWANHEIAFPNQWPTINRSRFY